jgi:hypothetical protein
LCFSPGFYVPGVVIVSWLTTQPFSVTEEKGEGFENGKKIVLALWSAFNLEPPAHRKT